MFHFPSVVLLSLLPAAMATAAPATSSSSFASAFFVSRNADGSLERLGSGVIWLLLAMSIVSMGLIGAMAMANRRKTILPETLTSDLRDRIERGDYKEAIEIAKGSDSFLGRVLSAAMAAAPRGASAMTKVMHQHAQELTTRRFRRVELLNVLGQISPMIGLFGTVYGMILAFQAIVASGGTADPVMLAGGIGTALTTTFWGLVVAIPALAGFAVLRNRIDELTVEATIQAEELLAIFDAPAPKPAPRRRSAVTASHPVEVLT